MAPECRLVIRADVDSRTAIRIDLVPLRHLYPLRGCNSDLAQYSITPSLRVAGFEDDDEDEDENEAPGEGTSMISPQESDRNSKIPRASR